MGKKSKGQTTGFRYFMSLQMGLGRGPINELVEIRVADQTAWVGSSAGGEIDINAPNLFGGDAKEGGIVGPFKLFMGQPDQVYPADFKAKLGDDGTVPDFRGVCTAVFDGMVCSGNPYPKEWKFRLRRQTAGWFKGAAWNPGAAVVPLAGGAIQAMNPAHIIYECATNPEWGRGLDPAQIDDSVWTRVADVLLGEGTGLCLQWSRQDDLDAFVQNVLDHIGGALFVSRSTGLLTLSLIRDDYDPDALFTYDLTNGLLSVEDDDGGSADQAYNEIIVKFHDPVTNQDGTVRAQNIAAFQANGSFVSTTKDYPGFPTKDLASRAAARELQVSASLLKRYKVNLDRRGWKIDPAGVFAISYNGQRVILRAVKIDDGSAKDGKIVVSAIQDVFGLPLTSYLAEQPSTYVPPVRGAIPPPAQQLRELTYRDLVRELTPADLNTVTEDQSFVGSLAVRPTGLSLNYELETAATGEDLAPRAQGNWTPTAIITSAVAPYDHILSINHDQGFDDDLFGNAVLIDDEICYCYHISDDRKFIYVTRGCVDTIPQPHDVGARVWWFDNDLTPDGREYASGETVSGVVLTRTSSDFLDPKNAITSTVKVTARQGRPYPPGDVQVNGTPIFNFPADPYLGDVTLRWAHRSRILEADQLVDHGAGSVGPEDGVTYTTRIFVRGKMQSEYTGINDVTWTYTAAMAAGDGNPPHFTIMLWAVRDEIESLMPYSVLINRNSDPDPADAGYGNNYGGSYGN